MRRVVITGLGLVTPLAIGVDETWRLLISGQSGIKDITKFDCSRLSSKIAGEIDLDFSDYGGLCSVIESYTSSGFLSLKQLKTLSPFVVFALIAAHEAMEQAGFSYSGGVDFYSPDRFGVAVGSGLGAYEVIRANSRKMDKVGMNRVSPHFIPSTLINMCGANISLRYNLCGVSHSVATACATGSHSIGDGYNFIRLGMADAMLVGGSDASISDIVVSGFCSCRALSTGFNDNPEQASRPFDAKRDGFVISEGSGVCVLEEYEAAKARGADIIAEIIGYGAGSDAYHIVAPSPYGVGAFNAMKQAINLSGISSQQVDYINAHGTSTSLGDEVELLAVEKIFDGVEKQVKLSSSKSMLGHMLGASGAVEAIISVLSLRDNVVTPTINLDNPLLTKNLHLIANQSENAKLRVAMSNSFGFGGTNSSLLFRQI